MEFLLFLAIIAVIGIFVFLKVAGSAGSSKESSVDSESFSATPILNKSERSLLKVLDQVVPGTLGQDVRIFAQVSYGEFLKGSSRAAHARVNQKRADFVAADTDGKVVCVVEYQGAGHYGRSQAARERAEKNDAVKRKALASAGIPLVEVAAKFTPEGVREQLADI